MDNIPEHQKKILDELYNKTADLKFKISQRRIIFKNNRLIKMLDFVDDYRNILSFIIEIIFYVGILSASLFLLWYMIISPIKLIFDNNETKYFEAIEMVFIAPLPLITIFTFYNYYMKILKVSLFAKQGNKQEYQKVAMQDIGITKYLFVSILISTIFIVLVEYIKAILTYNTIDSSHKKAAILLPNEMTYDKLFVGAAGGIILLVILIIYLNTIVKHLSRE